jgi:hypothetical protein
VLSILPKQGHHRVAPLADGAARRFFAQSRRWWSGYRCRRSVQAFVAGQTFQGVVVLPLEEVISVTTVKNVVADPAIQGIIARLAKNRGIFSCTVKGAPVIIATAPFSLYFAEQ